MLSVWKFFLKHTQFTLLLIVASVILGFLSLSRIPKESAPEVKIAVGIVQTLYPGASAEDVEKLVTNPLESGLSNLAKLDKITSSSRDNISVVSVQFTANADIDKSIQTLKDEVAKIKPDLPDEAKDPVVSEINFADQPIITFALSSDVTPTEFTALANWTKNQIKSISGVGKVEISGKRKRETQVVVNKEKLAAYRISLLDVIGAIRSQNAALPVGTIQSGGIDYSIAFEGDISSPSEVANIPINLSSGSVIYVRDIALVSDGVERATSIARISKGGEPSQQSLTFNVYKSSGSNILEVSTAVEEKIREFETTLKGTQTIIVFNAGDNIRKDIKNLSKTGAETMFLVTILLLLTLGWREALIASFSVPLSFLIAFTGLYYTGNSITFITLFSLILAIGILVDTGIVVVEAIHARLSLHKNKEDAAIAALEEYAWPLTAGTMTTIAVFAPLFFLSGIVGKFVASIPYTVIFVLIASIIVALGFIPYLAVKFIKKTNSKMEVMQEHYFDITKAKYRAFLTNFLGHPKWERLYIWGTVGLFIISVMLPATGLVKAIFFGQEDQTFIYLNVIKPEGTPLEETDITVRKIEEVLYTLPFIESFSSTIGRTSAFEDNGGTGGRYANISMNLNKKMKGSSSEQVELVNTALKDIHDADIRVLQINNGPPTAAPVSIKFLGDDLAVLEKVADNAANILRGIPNTKLVSATTDNANTEFALQIDRAKAARYGVSSLQVAQTLRAAVNGLTATVIKDKEEDIDVVVKLALDPRYTDSTKTTNTDIESIKSIVVGTPQGAVPLSNFLTSSVKSKTTVISHEDRKRVHSIAGYLTAKGNAGEITRAFEAEMAKNPLPEGVTMKTGGDDAETQKSFQDMMLAFAFGLVLMLTILVLEFNSFRSSLYLLSIVPLSLVGVFFGLFFFQQPLGFTSMLGVIALGGVIINHAIILMDSMKRIERRGELGAKDIVVEASVTRLRPILLTTITTVLGMIPLAFSSVLWGPLAFAIMFGLSYSLLLTLLFIPILYYRHLIKSGMPDHKPKVLSDKNLTHHQQQHLSITR